MITKSDKSLATMNLQCLFWRILCFKKSQVTVLLNCNEVYNHNDLTIKIYTMPKILRRKILFQPAKHHKLNLISGEKIILFSGFPTQGPGIVRPLKNTD
jgi:hypothetical protein